jgi:hypothetical protein
LIQEKLAELVEGHARREQMESRHQDLVGDRHGGAHPAATRPQAMILVLRVTALLPGTADGRGDEGRLEIDVAEPD